jgi:hypothetical protein
MWSEMSVSAKTVSIAIRQRSGPGD